MITRDNMHQAEVTGTRGARETVARVQRTDVMKEGKEKKKEGGFSRSLPSRPSWSGKI